MDPLKNFIKSHETESQNKYKSQNYTNSYVVFLDILGMKNLLSKKFDEVSKVFSIIESAKSIYSNINIGSDKFISEDGVKYLIMSDSIVLSICKKNDNSLSKIIGITSHIIKELSEMDKPIFIRGSIVTGKIYQDDSIVFGPGLAKAYLLESNEAKNMRCIISKDLTNDTNFIEYKNKNKNVILIDNDGYYFINFLNKDNISHIEKYAIKTLAEIKNINFFKFLLNIFCNKSNNSVKDKYNWLINYIHKVKKDNTLV